MTRGVPCDLGNNSNYGAIILLTKLLSDFNPRKAEINSWERPMSHLHAAQVVSGQSSRRRSASRRRARRSMAPKGDEAAAREGLDLPAAKLAVALAEEGAYGTLIEDVRGRLALFSTANGVTLRSGSASFAAVATLLRRGCVRWETGRSGRRRLFATEEGLSLARRLGAAANTDLSPFLVQHLPIERGDILTDEGPRDVLFNADESPLAWLHRRKGKDGEPLIDAGAFAAGERFRRDLTIAAMLPRVTANWTASVAQNARGAQGAAAAGDAVIAARQRVSLALAVVDGELAGLLIDVCGFLKSLDAVERERNWPRRSAKIVLRLALRQLAAHYGIEAQARGRSRSKGIERWLARGARPAITLPATQASV